MEEDLNVEMANALCRNFSEKAKEMGASVPTMLNAAIGLFTVMLNVITVPDPITGRKQERMMELAPGMIKAWLADNGMSEI